MPGLFGLFGGKKHRTKRKSSGLAVTRPVTHRERKGGVTTTRRGLAFSWGTPDPPRRRRRRRSK